MFYIPAFVFIGVVNDNTPQQNAGVFIGQINNGSWDANMKFQAAKTGNFDVMSTNFQPLNFFWDSFEFIDGVVNTQDIKPDMEANL
ncbi:hypothetical protein LLE49_25445 [Alicyclobacillus tolerans]|uniref:hypothetical protein n=1 Tax=Alicyclobacillus tolerans TaxID=90970 RepID=UPI001F2F2544|nr:hypothetical protein [Alicyclobacillus tolerans]MCF8568074.1 hypothetical protein [Alicyclobacillus tolerans]